MDFGWVPAGWFRGRASKLARAREKRKNRSGTFSTITLGAAAIAFLLALFGVGPFAVQAVVFDFGPTSGGALPATQVFPAVSPVQKVVDVYDPPRPAPAPPPSQQQPPPQEPQPSPSPEGGHHSPRPTPSPDNGGGGD